VRGVVVCGSGGGRPAAQTQGKPATVRVKATPRDAGEAAVLRRLSGPEAVRVFKQYNAAHGQQIQHHLAVIYGTDPEYMADVGGASRPLTDSIVGPVTLKWLTRFCREYGIVASDPQFEQDVVASLEQVAGIARAHPDWLKILFSADFEDWINDQPTQQRVRNFKIRRSGAYAQVNALIEQYLREQRPLPAGRPATPLELTYAYDPKRPAPVQNLKLIGERLKPLAERPPEDEDAFVEDVRESLAGLALDDDTLGLIKRYSQLEMYVLRAEGLAKLRKEGLAEPAVEELRAQLQDQEYEGPKAFDEALNQLAEASANRQDIMQAKRRIARGARVLRYRVPPTLAAELAADGPLAPPIAAVFAGIANVEYPTKPLFESALERQVRRALGMCRNPKRQATGLLQDEQLAALEAQLPEHADLFGGVRELREAGKGCSAEQQLDAEARAYRAYLELSPRLDRKMQLQTLHEAAPAKPRESGWAVPGCRCGRGEHDGMVYGFYPLWTDAGERQLDFGVLSRIGLYGLTADDQGALRGPAGFPDDTVPVGLAAMMRDAHRHNVKVDWVVGRNDWSAFERANKAGKRAVLAAMARNIIALLARPLPGGGETAVRMATFGADQGANGGDGVALYFRGYPAADRDVFNAFVLDLSSKLDSMWPKRRLSLIVDQDEMGMPGPFDYRNLIDLIATANPLSDEVGFASSQDQTVADIPVLVMLKEPTQESKKSLRGGVQDALRGTESTRLLRTIVPIVEYDGASSEQLTDDIVYAGDNYYGIGFWPLPFAGPGDKVGMRAIDTTSVNRLLALYFHSSDEHATFWGRYVASLCPQRLWVRWLFWGTLIVALCVGGYYFNCRGCNERLDSSGLYFVGTLLLIALPLIALLVLTVSDPLLQPYEPVILFLYAISGLVLAGLVTRYYFNKSKRKLP
jgi:hypothetical protein